MKQILILIGFFGLGILFSYLRGKIFKTTVKTLGCYVGNKYKKDGTEAFQWSKFTKIFSLFSGIEWVKSIKEIIDLRKLLIYLTIVGIVFAYGWWKGQGDKPVNIDIGRYEETIIKLNGEQLHIYKSGEVWIEESKTGKRIKQIKVKDVPLLNAKLAPIKARLKPIIVAGYGMSEDGTSQAEVGVGLSFLEFWKMALEGFLTQIGVYLGTSYRITDNTSIGISVGKGYRKFDNRIMVYGRVKF